MNTKEEKTKKENCIFCKIVEGEIPADIVYEDDIFLSFLDIKPVIAGHLLLIPKEHFEWIHETPDELVSKAFVITKKIINKMRENLPCDYVQIVVVGKDVPHFHIHLIPRMLNDDMPEYAHSEYKNKKEKEEIIKKLKS